MTQSQGTKPHRKFIALIVAASIAITGFSAAPARADEDVAKFIAGMALIGILGAAINDARKKDRHVTRTPVQPQPVYPNGGYHPRPLPDRVQRYDLPAHCLKYFPRYSQNRRLAGERCLQRNYGYWDTLPQACRVTFWNGQRNKSGYKPRCLRRHGYRMVSR